MTKVDASIRFSGRFSDNFANCLPRVLFSCVMLFRVLCGQGYDEYIVASISLYLDILK